MWWPLLFFCKKIQFGSYHWYIVLHLFSVSIAFSDSDIVIIVVLPVSPAFLLYFTNLRPFESCCMLTKAKPESARTKAEIQLFKYKSFTRSNFYYKTSWCFNVILCMLTVLCFGQDQLMSSRSRLRAVDESEARMSYRASKSKANNLIVSVWSHWSSKFWQYDSLSNYYFFFWSQPHIVRLLKTSLTKGFRASVRLYSSVLDHKWRHELSHTAAPSVPLFRSYHILTSSVINTIQMHRNTETI